MGLTMYQDGEDVIVAKDERPGALNGLLGLSGVLAVATVLLWQSGAFRAGPSEAWLAPLLLAAALLCLPTVPTWQEVRFDRAEKVLSVERGSRFGRRTQRVPFAKIVEVRAVYKANQSFSAQGHHVEVMLENWRAIHLNSEAAEEALARQWTVRLREFLGGRSAGSDAARGEAFTLSR